MKKEEGREDESACGEYADQSEWENWAPVFHGDTVHAQQEKTAPTVQVALEEPLQDKEKDQREAAATEKRMCIVHRRRAEARLWGSLAPVQQCAARDIAFAFEILSRGMGYALTDLQRLPGARNGSNNTVADHGRLIGHYMAWSRQCGGEGVSHSLVIDILVFGFSCRALDKDRRVRRGTTRENLLRGLDVYADLRGWQ